jgi:RNA polymerase sigma-70 factor (ECF subfamily)
MSPRQPSRARHRLADEDLMELVAAGDQRAFEILYERHGRAAYSLARRILGDDRAAEEATQEAFLQLWRSGQRYDPARGSVRSWTLRILRNRAIDELRRAGSSRIPPLELDAEVAERQPGPELTDAEVIGRETSRELRGTLARLPQEQAQVIELAYFAGFSQSEIGQLLGLPLGTVKSRTRLALERIRAELAEDFV